MYMYIEMSDDYGQKLVLFVLKFNKYRSIIYMTEFEFQKCEISARLSKPIFFLT